MAARVTKDDFEEKVLKESLPVVVDFYSDSCVACKMLAPVLGELEDEYEEKLKIVKVNTNFFPLANPLLLKQIFRHCAVRAKICGVNLNVRHFLFS